MTPDEFEKALREEEALIRRTQGIIDRACAGLSSGIMTPKGARELILETKRRILELMPDKEDAFNLIYLPRLVRMATQFGGIKPEELSLEI